MSVLMSESSMRQPSYMRYNRVALILDQEAAFKARMSPKTEALMTPDGEKQLFSPEVIAVTQAIHAEGKDAHKVQKAEIIKAAVKVFKIGQPRATSAAPAAPVQVTPEPPQPTTPAPVAPVAVPKAASKAASKTSSKPKSAPEVSAPAPKKKPDETSEAVEPLASAPKTDNSREAALRQARETVDPPRTGENTTFYNAMISIYSLVLSAHQLTELFDSWPGKEKRLKTLDDLAREVNKFTSIKSAKESQKA